MSAAPPAPPAATDASAQPAPGTPAAAPGSEGAAQQESTDAAPEERDRPQDAWSARRDLRSHTPATMRLDADARFGGSMVGGDQHGVSGGQVAGDVILGTKTEIHYRFGLSSPAPASGEVPASSLDRLAVSFTADEPAFASLVERLRTERVLVLTGPRFTGRRTAALMLLRRLGAAPVRILDRGTTPTELTQPLDESESGSADAPHGLLLCDLITRRDEPLRESHLLAVRERLIRQHAYLVVTAGPLARLEDVPAAEWTPPSAFDVLTAHLRADVDDETARRLLAHSSVAELLGRGHQLREIAAFARVLVRYARHEVDETAVEEFSRQALEEQVQEWFEEDEKTLPLRDKAFLVALAAFDGGPYALTAELSDLLYGLFQETQNRFLPGEIPVFGTHTGKRLQLARAWRYQEDEDTEWGPVEQTKAAYRDPRAALVLLREVWTGHPSARPGLVRWLQRLADDGRPLVRTRAASTVAVLARTDLPSAMALIIESWAGSPRFRRRLVAANALALTHYLETPNVPRILDDWCQDDDEGRCWTAVRTLALIGPERPGPTMAALRTAARSRYEKAADDGTAPDEVVMKALAESVELLLLSAGRDEVLKELVRTLEDGPAVRVPALAGFLRACQHTADDDPHGVPLILDWQAKNPVAVRHIAAMWRTALGDRGHTQEALKILRRWVLLADRSAGTERALAALLPVLVTTVTEHQRVSHLLRTVPGEDGARAPAVADRLHAVIAGR